MQFLVSPDWTSSRIFFNVFLLLIPLQVCAGDVAEKIDVYNIDSNLKVHSPVLVMVSVIFDRDYRNSATRQ